MAALVKVTGRRIEVIAQVIPDPPSAPPPSLPPGPVAVPPPARPPARDPWIYLGGWDSPDGFTSGGRIITRTIEVRIFGSYMQFTGMFAGSKQISAWRNTTIKLYPDYHPQARTLIPEWDYFNW